MCDLAIDRWIVTGCLELKSPLSIHTGEATPIQKEDQQGSVLEIELDAKGDPFIPATALKGMLRAFAAETDISKPDLEFLLGGKAENRGREGFETAIGGAAEIGQGWLEGTANPAVRGQTAIHAGTGTKFDRMLRQEKFVPPGAKFQFEIILDRAPRVAVERFLGLAHLIDGESERSALGSHKSQGLGLVCWTTETVKHLGAAEMRSWLDSDKEWRDCARVVELKGGAFSRASASSSESFEITLPIDGHFMTVGAVEERQRGTEKIKVTTPFVLKSNVPQLMGSGFDGPLFHQAAKIWRTLTGDMRQWKPEELPQPIALLFGSVKAKGLLSVTIFEGAETPPVEQEFVALDRFHGGSASGAKFTVKAFEAPELKGKIELTFLRKPRKELTGKSYDTDELRLTPEALGLLALVLWDLDEGDVRFGFGTRKGWGQPSGIGLKRVLCGLGEKAATHVEVFKGKSGEEAIRAAIAIFREVAKQHHEQTEKVA